jgi:hypothetical protein
MATAASETFIFIPGMAGVGRFRFYSNHHRSNDVYLLNVFSTPELEHTLAAPRESHIRRVRSVRL